MMKSGIHIFYLENDKDVVKVPSDLMASISGLVFVLVLLDLSAAFSTAHHNILIQT